MNERMRRRWVILSVRINGLKDRYRDSMFVLPALYVAAAIALAEILLAVDAHVDNNLLPPFLLTTVDSARALLGVVAAAVITVAGLVLGFVVIAVQLASSQFSPRVLRQYYRSRFQARVIGLTVGTFAYCLLVLRAVHAPITPNGDTVVPGASVAVAVLLGIVSAISILAYVDYLGHAMRVGDLIDHIANETLSLVRALPMRGVRESQPGSRRPTPDGEGYIIRARHGGWIQQAPIEALFAAIPPKSVLRLDVRVGMFVAAGVRLCTVWPMPENPGELEDGVHDAIPLGRARTMQEDLDFGLRQLVDIAMRALSPAVNDPTTAYEVIVHLGAILRELLMRDLPATLYADDEGRCVIRSCELTHADYVGRAFDQIRRASANQPAIGIALIQTLGTLCSEIEAAGFPDRAALLCREASLVYSGLKITCPLAEDLEQVRVAAERAGFQVVGHRIATPVRLSSMHELNQAPPGDIGAATSDTEPAPPPRNAEV